MKTTFLLLFAFALACIAGEPPSKIRVAVSFQGVQWDLLQSNLKGQLRKLGDVELVDEHGDYDLGVLCQRYVSGRTTVYVVALSLTQPLRFGTNAIVDHLLETAAVLTTAATCTEDCAAAVAGLDTRQFDTLRRWRSRRDVFDEVAARPRLAFGAGDAVVTNSPPAVQTPGLDLRPVEASHRPALPAPPAAGSPRP